VPTDEAQEEGKLAKADGKLALNIGALRGSGKDDAKSRLMSKVVAAMAEAAQQEHDKDESDIRTSLNAVLNTAPAQTALGDHLAQRIDAVRMRGEDKVDAEALLREIVHSTTPPSNVDPSHITWWCSEHLGLTIGGAAKVVPKLTSDALKVTEKAKGGELSGKKGAEVKLKAAEAVAKGEAAAATLMDESPGATWTELVAAINALARTLSETQPETESLDENAKPKNLRERLIAWAVLIFGIDTAQAKRKRNAAEAAAQGSNKEGDIMLAKPWYIVPHTSLAYTRFHKLFLLGIAWDTLSLPIVLCFIKLVVFVRWFEYTQMVLDVIYWVRIAICFNTTYVNSNSVVVVTPMLIRRNYLATDCILDVIAAFPLDHFALALNAHHYVAYSLRIMRLLNVRYVRNAYMLWQKSLADDDLLIGLVHYLAILMLAAHFLACIWNLLGYATFSDPDTPRWTSQYLFDIEDLGVGTDNLPNEVSGHAVEIVLGYRYLVALYYVMAMLTTLGSTQVPSNYAEAVFFIATMIANLTVYAQGGGRRGEGRGGAGSASGGPPAPRARACSLAAHPGHRCRLSPRGAPQKR
jgi:hypothetical protein